MGLYDRVSFTCPNCRKLNEFQTKMTRDPCLANYSIDNAPLLAIADMHDDGENNQLYCEHCDKKLLLKINASVTLSLADENEPKTYRIF